MQLLAAAMLAGFLLTACVSPPTAGPSSTPSPSISEMSPPPAPQRTIDPLPDTASKATVLLSDPSMVFTQTEQEAAGPETFWVHGDLVTIADHLNSRIVTFRDGQIVETLEWPVMENGEPVPAVDLAIDGDLFYFLAFMEPSVYVHQRVDGRLAPQRLIDFSSPNSSQVDMIELEDGNLVGVTYSGRRFLIEGPGPLAPDPVLDIDERLPSHIVQDGALNARLLTQHEPVGIHLLQRDASGSYYWTAESYYSDDIGNVYVLHVYQFASDGSLVRTFTPHRDVDHVPNRELRVVNDQLYQLLDRADSAEVVLLHPDSAKR
ncbi:MAG: hypothetical protein QM628_16420 [Propionicimonas sp.]